MSEEFQRESGASTDTSARSDDITGPIEALLFVSDEPVGALTIAPI